MTLAFRSRETSEKIWNGSEKNDVGKNQNAIEHSMRHRMPQSFDDAMMKHSAAPTRA
jgi:hypothetical protein